MKKRLIGLLMILVMIVSLIAVPTTAQAKTKSYLVLVETEKGSWKEYTNLDYVTGSGSLMMKASSVSKFLGLTYNNYSKTFTVSKGTKKLTFTKNSKSFNCYNGTNTSKKSSSYKAYTATISKSKVNLVHYKTLGNLVYTQYYTGKKIVDYNEYKGVICYSTVGKITNLPSINNVINANDISDSKDTDNGKDDNPHTIRTTKNF